MITQVSKSLSGENGNYIMPFFWQHGEEEAVLRKYMEVIHNCGIGAVCIESRPHPDFCGEQWWKDMEVILEEAKRYNMKVWILDDSHFPTGYANGALEEADETLCRQGVCYMGKKISSNGREQTINVEKFLKKKNTKFSIWNIAAMGKKKRVFSEDTFFSASAVRIDKNGGREIINLTENVQNGKLKFKLPEGKWKVGICKLSRNCGAHRNYMNMLNPESCRILIDAVYEPHYEQFKSEFGGTIAGFFSDEPELGNGSLYSNEKLGTEQDLPWCYTLEKPLEQALGVEWKQYLPFLWENNLDPQITAKIRYSYMDTVSKGVENAFSMQIGNWCRERGVEYIGHMVEDNNNHARTGASLGHYFRGLSGQDMAGIDDIGGQVFPQGEDGPDRFMKFQKRDGEFYHYILGRLGPSLAAIDPGKKGRTMCEIFGNYGWAEGLRLEKYLADHFMVNGVNHFVPHAFSAKTFPDPDCPPHFYANGHNPQYRHFRYLMEYINRVCELLNGGHPEVPVALLYHGEAEWTGECMLMQKPGRKLLDAQINFDILPTDAFQERERYHVDLAEDFRVNTQRYRALIVPYAQYISKSLAEAVKELERLQIPVFFVENYPNGFYDSEDKIKSMPANSRIVQLEELVSALLEEAVYDIRIRPIDDRIRYIHYKNETDIYYFVNEGTENYSGEVILPQVGEMYAYDAWDNCLETGKKTEKDGKTTVHMELEPYQSCIFIFDSAKEMKLRSPLLSAENTGKEIKFTESWRRSTCKSIDYPSFDHLKQVELPDRLAEELPAFSGWVRYENTVYLRKAKRTILVITDAYEGVEVLVNGHSAGVKIVPIYRFDITDLVQERENKITIEVSTTLERERWAAKDQTIAEKMMKRKVPAPTGITGEVMIYEED